jgi:hypothetical protein
MNHGDGTTENGMGSGNGVRPRVRRTYRVHSGTARRRRILNLSIYLFSPIYTFLNHLFILHLFFILSSIYLILNHLCILYFIINLFILPIYSLIYI